VAVIWGLLARPAGGQETPGSPSEILQLQDALSRDPGNRQLRLDLARRLSWTRRYDESVVQYRQLLEGREDLAIRFELAQVLSWAGRFAESVAAYDRLIAAGRDDPETRLARARVLSWDRRYDQAIEAYQTFVRRWPDHPEASDELIDVLTWAKRYDEALAAADVAVAREPASRRAALQRARILNWSGQLARAREAYDRVLDLNPENREAQFERAQVATWLGLPLTAERLLREVLGADPSHALAHQHLGDLYRWFNYLRGAQREYKDALRLDPGSKAAEDGLRDIRQATRPALQADGQYYNDSNGFRRWVARAGARVYLRPDVSLEGNYLHWLYQPRGSTVAEDSLGLSATWRPSLRWTLSGGGFANLFNDGDTTGTGFARIGLQALDRTALSLGYARFDIFSGAPAEAVGAFWGSTQQAVRLKIQGDEYALGAVHQFTDWLTLSTAGRYGQYHDKSPPGVANSGDNDWYSAAAEVAVRPAQAVDLRVGYRFFFLHVARFSSNFFSPSDFQNQGGFVDWRQPLFGGLGLLTDFTLTWVKGSRPFSDSLGAAFRGGLTYTLPGRLEAQAKFTFEDSNLTGKASFVIRQYGASLVYRF
jgi:tetratricopeptide (TPR) repeat protein